MTAQKIASCVTRGLVSAQYWDVSWPSERWVADDLAAHRVSWVAL